MNSKHTFKKWFLPYKTLTTASVKMYFRNKTAVFFTLFIPVMFILIFGAFNSGGASKVKLAVINNSSTETSKAFVSGLEKASVFTVKQTDLNTAKDQLDKGKTDLVVVLPQNFGNINTDTGQLENTEIQTYYNKGQPQVGQSGSLVIGQIASGFNSQITKSPQIISVKSDGISTHNLSYLDYLVPGILALSIMQLGIFSIAFAFVSFKSTGALRRLHVTPTNPLAFIFGQSMARLLISIMQVGLLVAISAVIFKVQFVGNILAIFALAILGTIVFLAFGFAIAGWAKDENQAAPVANLISFPMLFLSGVFFPTDGLPTWLQKIVGLLPLTFLADAMRSVSTQGATLWEVRGDILGLLVWGIIAFIIAVKVFKWE